MKGDVRERRMLHEHEVVLFSFMFAFLVVGLFVWGVDANASEYSVNGVVLIDGSAVNILAKNGVERTTDLVLKNSLVEGVESSSIVILEIDSSCKLLSEEALDELGEILPSVCDSVTTELVDGSVVYTGESNRIRLGFHSDYTSSADIVFNVITTEGINTLVVKFESTDEGEVVIIDEGLVVQDNPLVDLIRNLLGAVEDEILLNAEDPIVFVDEVTNVGLTTRPQLVFGTLDISEAEQKTKTVEFENIGPDLILFEGVEGKLPGIILTGNLKTGLAVGERVTLDITCAPPAEGSYGGDVLTLVTNRGNLDLEIYCEGVIGFKDIIDEVSPVVSIIEPIEGDYHGVIHVKLAAYDEGTIYDVAIVKVYIDSKLIKRYTNPLVKGSSIYEFDYDTSSMDTAIVELYAVAIDYAGNQQESERVPLWVSSEVIVGVIEPTLELDFGSGYFDVKTPVPLGVTTANLRIKYSSESMDSIFEFKSIELANFDEFNVDKTNAVNKFIGNQEIIDVPDKVMNYFIDELNAGSVVMPLDKPANYVVGNAIEMNYFRADGTSFDLMDEDILSVVEGSDGMLYVEVSGDVIREKD